MATVVTSVAGAVLAGGASSRMGRPKAFIEIDGRTLIDRAVGAL
ncbi:MAG: nucleotidyltransferase family protein, partial [Acidimicrobiia bacterium]|nr:nucleotidyltransferase family protein [Acidimicrobiia bacterium]